MDLDRRGNFHYKLSRLLELDLHYISQNLFLILLNFRKEFVQTWNPVKLDNALYLGNSFMGHRLKWGKGVEKGTIWSAENHGRIRGLPVPWNPKPHHRMFPKTPASREEATLLWAATFCACLAILSSGDKPCELRHVLELLCAAIFSPPKLGQQHPVPLRVVGRMNRDG